MGKHIRANDKYIRVKDNIYEKDEITITEGKTRDDGFLSLSKGEFGINHLVNEKDIIKKSDKLQDLFDAIVSVTRIGNVHQVYESENDFLGSTALGYATYLDGNMFYGAVWTDWGLKYVAVFNGKWKLR